MKWFKKKEQQPEPDPGEYELDDNGVLQVQVHELGDGLVHIIAAVLGNKPRLDMYVGPDQARAISKAIGEAASAAEGVEPYDEPDAIRELTEAIRLTVDYVGTDMLPPIEGWDWYDAMVKYDPDTAARFLEEYVPPGGSTHGVVL